MDSAGHPELATMLDGVSRLDSRVRAHVERCSDCKSELALYRSYERAGDQEAEDLRWITERLAVMDAWSGARKRDPVFASLNGLERLAAAGLLLVLSPAMLLVCLIVFAKARRWPLIRHERIGRGGSVLRMLKLRTMWPSSNEDYQSGATPPLKSCRDPRITSRFAAFCRRFSIDELPQLLHVATGQMSFVGPRPLTAPEFHRYYAMQTAEVLSVRPGMAGLWQAMGRSRLTYSQRRRFDIFYVRHASVRLYFHVLFRTIPRALMGKDAW